MLQARSVMNFQSQLGYCTDIAIFTSHSEGLLAFAMSMRLKLSASSVYKEYRPVVRDQRAHFKLQWRSRMECEALTSCFDLLNSTHRDKPSMFYRFNNCFKKKDYQQRSLPMIGHPISKSARESETWQ